MTLATTPAAALPLTHRRPLRGWALVRRPGPAAMPPQIGCYQVQRKVGEGRLATVYLAHDGAGSPVALKVLRRECAGNDARTAAFAREFAVPLVVPNRHIVRVFDQVASDGCAAIAMEYIGGGHLGGVIRDRLTPDAALFLLRQAAVALQALHGQGFVHGDVKPANLLLRSTGELVLADFGLAWRLDDARPPAQPGLVFGTPRYAAPEQVRGGAFGTAADVYGLGVVCYEMLCGKPPFAGETALEVISQHLMAPVPRLPGELARLQPLVDAMLAKRADNRLQDGHALLRKIDLIQGAASLHPAQSAHPEAGVK